MVTVEEIKRRYPLGTKFKCVHGNKYKLTNKDIHVVTDYYSISGKPEGYYGENNGWMYLNGVFAEIVNENKNYLIY